MFSLMQLLFLKVTVWWTWQNDHF